MIHSRILPIVVAGLLAMPVAAQVANPDARVSLRVQDRSLEEVVRYLQEQSGANVVIKDQQNAQSIISIDLTDIPWRDALDLAAELAGCVVEARAAGVLVIDKPPRVTFSFDNADVRAVIDAIGKISGANIVVAPEVAGTLSLRFKEVPWRDALDVVAKTLGFTVVQDTRGILRVVDPVSLQAQMESRAYQLRYVRPPSKYQPVITSEFLINTQQVKKQQSGGQNADPIKSLPIFQPLSAALSQGGDIDYVEAQNVLIVRDTAQVHETIKLILERLDVEPAQVFVDVKFISTSNTDLFNLGVDYGDSGPQISLSGGQIPVNLPFDLGDGGWEDGIIANDSGDGPFTDPLLNAGATVVPDTIFGALSFTQFAATLRLLQRDSRTEVVQAPKLIALDGREATIFVGETIRYAEAKSEQGQAGGLSLSVTEASSSPVEVGFQLLVVPHIVPGTNKLVMDVIPKETSLSGTGNSNLAPPGFDVYTIGASGLEGSIALPRKRSSTIVTSMMLESGQTAVIGGLSTDVDSEQETKVPLLGDIPILGELFKHENTSRDRRNLMVFVTPTIVRSSFDQERLLRQEIESRKQSYSKQLRKLLDDSVQAVEPMEAPAPPPVATFTDQSAQQ